MFNDLSHLLNRISEVLVTNSAVKNSFQNWVFFSLINSINPLSKSMASGHKHNHHHHHHPSTTKKESPLFILPSQFENPKIPTTTDNNEERNPNLNPNNSNPNFDTTHIMEQGADANANANVNVPLTIDGIEEDEALGGSEYLTREELIRRRFRRTKQIEKLYRDHYWGLMEEVRVKYRDYYWRYGVSPFKEDEEVENAAAGNGGDVEGSGENNNNNICSSSNRLGFGENFNIDLKNKKCAFPGCKSKAMALTNYCHPHILLDPRQKLYKPCTYVIKSVPTGPVHCGKPILTATVPSLCTVHFQKAQTHVTRALRKAGLNVTSSSKLAPKFHLIVAESVRQINAQRRERKAAMGKSVVKEENAA